MGLLSWWKGKALTRIAAQNVADINAGRYDEEQSEFIIDITSIWSARAFRADGTRLDVLLQSFAYEMLSTEFAAAEAGTSPFTPHELWVALFTAVLMSRSHSSSDLSAAITRLEDRSRQRA